MSKKSSYKSAKNYFKIFKNGGSLSAEGLSDFTQGMSDRLSELIDNCNDNDPDKDRFLSILNDLDHTMGKEVQWALQAYEEWQDEDDEYEAERLEKDYRKELKKAKNIVKMNLNPL